MRSAVLLEHTIRQMFMCKAACITLMQILAPSRQRESAEGEQMDNALCKNNADPRSVLLSTQTFTNQVDSSSACLAC